MDSDTLTRRRLTVCGILLCIFLAVGSATLLLRADIKGILEGSYDGSDRSTDARFELEFDLSAVLSNGPDEERIYAEKEILFDQEIDSGSPEQALYQHFRHLYPEEFAKLRERTVLAMVNGATQTEIEFEKIGALFDFYREQGGAFAAAAPDALLWVREGHVEAIRQLAASNPDACAHYQPDSVRLKTMTDEEDKRVLANAGIRNISTIKVGQEIAFQRPEASQADLSALRDTMLASGFTSHEFSLALSGGQNSDTGTNRRCASNVGFYEALNDLPAEQADRLTARFLRPGV